MAGHSKWANIRHHKGVQDVRRGRLFTKIIREITIAARQSSDPDSNPRLRAAMDKALDANMTKDTVERAIQRGTGELEGARYEEIRYEGYGPGGAAVIVECQTDNRTRTVGEVRHAFSKHGGNLGQEGSVAYLFNKTGLLTFSPGTREDQVMETALDAGVEDVVTDGDGTVEVLAAPEQLPMVVAAMKAAGLKPVLSEIVQRPTNFVSLAGVDAEKMLELLEALEDLDDVQHVHTNADFQTPGG